MLLSASPGLFALARYAILDTLFSLFVFGGAALVTVAALCDRPRLQYGGYVLIALAVLTKGPVAMALCGTAFVLAIAVSADARRRLLGLRWVVGLALVVVIAAPWFVYMWWRFGDAFIGISPPDTSLGGPFVCWIDPFRSRTARSPPCGMTL